MGNIRQSSTSLIHLKGLCFTSSSQRRRCLSSASLSLLHPWSLTFLTHFNATANQG